MVGGHMTDGNVGRFPEVDPGLDGVIVHFKQVKPGYTNYQPRGLAKRICNFFFKNYKFETFQKFKKSFKKMPKILKISRKS